MNVRFPLLLTLFAVALGSAACQEDDPKPLATAPFALTPAANCDVIRGHVLDVAVETIVQNRYGANFWRMGVDFANDGTAAPGTDEKTGPDDFTTTNVQEAGVDELDFVKTDGSFIYTTRDNALIIVKSWPVDDLQEVARVPLTSQTNGWAWAQGLFLHEDRVITLTNVGHYDTPESAYTYGTQIAIFDVSDRSQPLRLATHFIEGWTADARMIDGKVYLVSNAELHLPYYTWDYTWASYPGVPDAGYIEDESQRLATMAAARPYFRALLNDATQGIDTLSIFPKSGTVDAQGVMHQAPLFACTDVYLPPNKASLGLLTISHLRLDEPDFIHHTGLLASGWTVYASQQNLYVAMSSRWWWWGWGNTNLESHIHKFHLNGPGNKPVYAASGHVEGWLLNQFAMSEFGGHLRVATTNNNWEWNEATNESDVTGGSQVTILQDQQGELTQVGFLGGLAPGEQIFAVRMVGNRGFMVTFRQTDPLFTIDLANPHQPKLLGELKINGFSSYIHMMGEDHLLTIGQDADDDGRVIGVHLQIFDVSDMRNPTRTHQELLSTGSWSSWSEAMWDHHAFTYHQGKGILAVPVNIYNWDGNSGENFSGLVVYRANTQGFTPLGRVNHANLVTYAACMQRFGEWGCDPDWGYDWWTTVRRSIFMDDYLFSLSDVGIKINDLLNPAVEHAFLVF